MRAPHNPCWGQNPQSIEEFPKLELEGHGQIQTWHGKGRRCGVPFVKGSPGHPGECILGMPFPPATGKDVLLGALRLPSDIYSACRGVQSQQVPS